MRVVFGLFLISGCVVGEKITTVTGPTGPMGATGADGTPVDASRLDTLDQQVAAVSARQAIVTFTAKHKEEVGVASPFAALPIGLHIIDAQDANGNPLAVVGPPKLNRTRTDGLLGVTVRYGDGIGEELRVYAPQAANETGVTRNVASLTLPPGVWDLSAMVGLIGNPTTYIVGIAGLTGPGLSGLDGDMRVWFPSKPTGDSDVSAAITQVRATPLVETTYELFSRATWTGGVIESYGRISAVRVEVDPETTATIRAVVYAAQ